MQFAIDGSNFGSPVTLSAAASPRSATRPWASAGTHTVVANYSGDSSFAASSGTLSGGQTVNQATTTTAVTASVNPSTFGQNGDLHRDGGSRQRHFDNGGTVQFVIDGSNFGSPVTLAGGTATINDAALASWARIRWWPTTAATAASPASSGTLERRPDRQPGDDHHDGHQLGQPVGVRPESVTFTATVTPGSGTCDNGGTVQFVIDGSNFGSPVTLSQRHGDDQRRGAWRVGTPYRGGQLQRRQQLPRQQRHAERRPDRQPGDHHHDGDQLRPTRRRSARR